VLGIGAATAGPLALTAILSHVQSGQSREYAFLYLALVAALGLFLDLTSSLVAAAVSFLCVDYFFVPPVHQLSIADETDLVNLLVFFGAAGVIGGLSSRRRRAQLEAEALSRRLRVANEEMERLNREQADTARTAVRLAHTEQQVRVLQETDRLRRELLQNVSHELRTPLASILTGTTAFLDQPKLSAPQRELLTAIAGQARRLNRLVGDMLDMARIEGGALDLVLDEMDMGEAATAAAERLRRISRDRTVEVVVTRRPVEVVADWDRVGQVMDNLLMNADRFAPPESAIEVRITPGARGNVVTQVTDHGPGVAPELRERIFERFVGQRPPERDGRAELGGTGLGLAIVRGLVEAQAGRVWLDDSEPGANGARFAFSLPAAHSGEGQDAASPNR
jgi:two-component system sensor histidine kinase KdpD